MTYGILSSSMANIVFFNQGVNGILLQSSQIQAISSLMNYRAYRDDTADNSSLFCVKITRRSYFDRNKGTRPWNRETTFMAARLSVVSGVHLNIAWCVVLRTRPPCYVLAPICVRACYFTGRSHDRSMCHAVNAWRRRGCVIGRYLKAWSSPGRTAGC